MMDQNGPFIENYSTGCVVDDLAADHDEDLAYLLVKVPYLVPWYQLHWDELEIDGVPRVTVDTKITGHPIWKEFMRLSGDERSYGDGVSELLRFANNCVLKHIGEKTDLRSYLARIDSNAESDAPTGFSCIFWRKILEVLPSFGVCVREWERVCLEIVAGDH